MSERIVYLDAYRGFAVILMVQQHLQSWLWSKQWLSYGITFPQHPVMLSFNFLGNFSAAMFLIAAGIGSAMLYDTNLSKNEFFKRGIFILLCGYILNVISPHWFKPGSWYILHTIGISVFLAPFLNRIRNTGLITISAFFIIVAALIQTWLNTPLMLGNEYMNNITMNGGVFRLIFAEGHFPLFPWMAFFITGIVCQRWIVSEKKVMILFMAIGLFSLGYILSWFHNYGYFFATGGKLFRLFVFLPYVYPSLPPLMLIIAGINLFFLYIFSISHNYISKKLFVLLSVVGRLSLSWFFIHIIIFNEIFTFFGIRRNLTAFEVLFIISITTILIFIFSNKWNKINLKFSLEWVMRRVIKH
jgi:hypothetical protein